MILYKYVTHEAGMKILQNGSLGFTQPCHFNDPFEVEAAYPHVDGNPFEALQRKIQNWAKKDILKRNTGILSLTRQPLNPLMWAHYGNEHKGMVIGIDASIPEFTCERTNLVPIQFGSVIYTNKKPDHQFLSYSNSPFKLDATFHFPQNQFERLQRMFLHKAACWSYEEEVRVVKCIKGAEHGGAIESGRFSRIDVNGRPLYLLNLPKGVIREVYIGLRSDFMDADKAVKLAAEVRGYQPDAKLYGCRISDKSWDLDSFELEKLATKVLEINEWSGL